MPMTAVQSYQNLSVNPKLTQLQAAPRRLAPAPIDSRCKKKSYIHQSYPAQTPSVVRRNARERNRVKQVNNGFSALRQHIPPAVLTALMGARGSSRKLSKVDTLRIALEYIKGLKRMLDESEEDCSETQLNLSLSSNGSDSLTSSEDSCSETPSIISENSAEPNCQDNYDAYDRINSADEALLDAITWWQAQ